ncbi:MAG TPA: hypothetical protein VHC22_33950 [Pirellulales bacterium]|nr:hypothetical protein [Pirellulales bacterium]
MIEAPNVVLFKGGFVDIYRGGERHTPAAVRRLVRRNMANIEQGGREAGAVIRWARGEKITGGWPRYFVGALSKHVQPAGRLSIAELADLAGRTEADVEQLEGRGVPELAGRELLGEVYGPLSPSPTALLQRSFDERSVAATVRHGRRGRDAKEIEALVWLDREFILRLEQPGAWRGVTIARDVLAALNKHGVKATRHDPIRKVKKTTLAERFWSFGQFN